MNKEIWKDIENYEGLYQISNYGRVKHLEMVKNVNNAHIIVPEHILKLSIIKGGYKRVMLFKENKYKTLLVHRLVAEAFIPNPDNKPLVLHKKSIRNGGNNNVENLYWGNRSDNTKDMIKDGTWNKPKRKKYNKKIIQQLTKNNEVIKTWYQNDEFPYNKKHVYEVCNGKRKTAYGYKWKCIDGTPQAEKVS